MKKSTIWHAVRICILYAYVFICVVILIRLQTSRYDKSYYLTVRTITAVTEQKSSTTGLLADALEGIDIHHVLSPTSIAAFIPPTFGELQYAWPNGVPMAPSAEKAKNTRWFLDRESKTIGPARILVTCLSQSKQQKIPRYFTEYFSGAFGFLSEGEIEKSKIVVHEREMNYTIIDPFYLLRGNSRSTYGLMGNQAIVSVSNWRDYYITLSTTIMDLYTRTELVPRGLVISYNIGTANTFRLSTIDLIVEFLPSGECSARLEISSIKIATKEALGFNILRSLVIIMALTHLGVAVVDISTMGFKKYITHWYGITKFLLSISGMIACLTTISNHIMKFMVLDKLFNAPSDKFLDLHSVLSSELLDSCALATFLLLLCFDFVVAIKDAMGLKIISVVSAKGLRMSLAMLLIFMIYSRAAAISANVFARGYDLMVGFFSRSIFPLAGKDDENQLFFIVALTILCVFSKFCLAMFIYHFEVFDGNYVSEYHPGRSAAVLSKLAPLRDTNEVKMRYIKKYSVRQRTESPPKMPNREPKSMSLKIEPRKTYEPLPGSERKLEAREFKLKGKFFK